MIQETWMIAIIDDFPGFHQICIIDSTIVGIEPILSIKAIAHSDTLRKLFQLTSPLNVFQSG